MKRETLTFEKRQRMIDYLTKRAQDANRPLTIAFVDETRTLVSLTMMEGMASRSTNLVTVKAYTAALMQKRTADWWEQMKSLNIGLEALCDPKMTYLPGGAPIFTKDGDLIGAIGVSGWAMEEDQMLADEAVAVLE